MSENTKKILLAEDEETLRNLYKTLLQNQGLSVDTANNGEEAYEKIKKNQYNLILLDVMMPIYNGFEIIEKLIEEGQGNPVQPLSKFVLLTNLSNEKTKKKAQHLQVKDYLVKSDLDPQQFLTKVEAYLS